MTLEEKKKKALEDAFKKSNFQQTTQNLSKAAQTIKKNNTTQKTSAGSSSSAAKTNTITTSTPKQQSGLSSFQKLAEIPKTVQSVGNNVLQTSNDMRNLQRNSLLWHGTTDTNERARLKSENDAIRQRLGLLYDNGNTYNPRTGQNLSTLTDQLYGNLSGQRANDAARYVADTMPTLARQLAESNPAEDKSLGERVLDTIEASTKRVRAGLDNWFATGNIAADEEAEQKFLAGEELGWLDQLRMKERWGENWESYLSGVRDAYQTGNTAIIEDYEQRARALNNLYDTTPLFDEAEQQAEAAKAGLGMAGRTALDAIGMGADMLGAASIASTGGGGAGLFTGVSSVSAAGQAADQARRMGASAAQQEDYGNAVGALNFAVERLGGIGGGQAATKIANRILPEAVKNAAGKVTSTAVGRVLAGGAEEGLEGAIQSEGERALRNAILDANERFDPATFGANTGYSALMGSIFRGGQEASGAIRNKVMSTSAAQQGANTQAIRDRMAKIASTQDADVGTKMAQEAMQTALGETLLPRQEIVQEGSRPRGMESNPYMGMPVQMLQNRLNQLQQQYWSADAETQQAMLEDMSRLTEAIDSQGITTTAANQEANTQALGARMAELDAQRRQAESMLPGPMRDRAIAEAEQELQETAQQAAVQSPEVQQTAQTNVQVPASEAIRYGETPQQAMMEAQVRAEGEAAQAAKKIELSSTVDDLMQAWTDKRAAEKQAEKTRAGLTLTNRDINMAEAAAKNGIETQNWSEADNPEQAYIYGSALRQVREADRPIRQYFAERADEMQTDAQKAADAIATYAKDKRFGGLYQRETMERNIRDIFGKEHQDEAESIIKEYLTPVHKAVAQGNRLKNKLRDRVKALKLNKHESALTQMRLEKEDAAAAEYIQNNKINLTPEMDAKISRAVEEFRSIYNELYNAINKTLLLTGQEPAPFRQNYAPHFVKDAPDTLLGKVRFALGLGKDSSVNIPTDIAGLTDTFRPGKKWFGNLLQREGEITDYDAVAGFDRYVETAADVITLTDSIQKLRALEDQVRYTLSDEGVKAQIDKIKADANLDALQQREQIEKVYDDNRTTVQKLIADIQNQKRMGMGRFVTELRRYTDNLAGKKSREDRGWEDFANRQVYTLAKNLEGRVAANMISLNPGSWLTNFIPITQATGEVSVQNLLRGMYQTVKASVKDDGYVDASTFLTNRYGSQQLDRTLTRKVSDISGAPMELIDHFTANTIHRARYNQNIEKGMSVSDAIDDADAFTASLMADRSKGAVPTVFNATNPVRKVFTMFQTEVNNQLSYLFKDMPKAQRQKGVAAVAWAYTKVFAGAYFYNLLYSQIVGRDAALDPIGMIADALGVGDDEDEEKTAAERVTGLVEDIGGQIPFIGGILFDGGRVPISSAIPNFANLGKAAMPGLFGVEWSGEKRLQTAAKELAKPATYLLPPFGGGAAKKAIEGFATVKAGGSYTYDNQGNLQLQFPAYGQSPMDYAKAMLFGKWSSEEAQKYIDSGFKGLSADETSAYNNLRDNMGVNPRDAMEAILSIRGFESVKDAEGNTLQTVKEQQRMALFDNEKLTPEQKAAIDSVLIVSGEDEMPADYTDRNSFILGQYINENRQDAARAALESGLTVDQFVQWDDRLSELTNEKGTDDKKVRTAAEARSMVLDEVLQNSALSDSEKEAIADYVIISSIGEEDEKTRQNWENIAKGKVNASDFVRFQADASIYDDWAEGTGTDNAANVAKILRGYEGLTDEQRDVLFQTYRDNMSVNPFHVSVYEKAIDPNGSFFSALTDDGKARLRSLLNEYEQDINEGAELDEWRAKAYMAEKEAGIAPGIYAMYRVALETANTDGKGNPRQSEAEACVNAMDGLTQYQKAYLYASTNSSWKNNPFGNATVGEYSSGLEIGINPIEGGMVTSGFGPRDSFQTDNGAMSSSNHPSIDIGAPEGTPIGAYKSGKVTKNGWVDGYGWTIEVTHSDGTVSAYHHMMEQSPVPVGTEVTQGDQIGKVGQTGNSKGAHLDLTITRDGKPIDPASLIPELKDSATGYVWTGSNVYTNVTSGSGESSGGSSGSSGLKSLNGLKNFKSLPTF